MITNHDTSINETTSQVLQKKNNEWYTPSKYIEAARLVMGGIDLDPASCAAANQVIKATTYYTQEQNGLDYPWSGRVWLNPPYARTLLMQAYRQSLIGMFMEKLRDAYAAGHVEQAIALVTTEVNARWFVPLWQYPICFPDHRIHFIVPTKRPHGDYKQMFGSAFVYFGPNEKQFIDVFQKFGRVVKRVSPPKQELCTALDLWSALNTSVDQESCRETA